MTFSALSFAPALVCFYCKDFCFVYLCIGGLILACNGAKFYAHAYGKRTFEKVENTTLSQVIKEKSIVQENSNNQVEFEQLLQQQQMEN